MTWNTPSGPCVLQGEARSVVAMTISLMTEEIIFQFPFARRRGERIEVYDTLDDCQKLVMLDYVKTHLLVKTDKPNDVTAVVEGTAAAVLRFFQRRVHEELKEEESDHIGGRHSKFWRKFLYKLSKEHGWPTNPQNKRWDIALKNLYGMILADKHYLMDVSDEPPEVSEALRMEHGIAAGYFDTPAFAEPKDSTAMLELIRRLKCPYPKSESPIGDS